MQLRKREIPESPSGPAIPEEEFGELLDRWYEGDDDALATIWQRWGPGLIRRVARGHLAGVADYSTSDLNQSVLCSLLMMSQRSRSLGDCPPAFRAYVTAVAIRRAIKRSMRSGREIDASRLWVRSESPDPAAQAEGKEQSARVQARLGVMRAPDTVRLLARDVPLRIVAELHGRSLSAVKNQLGRDRQNLKATQDDES